MARNNEKLDNKRPVFGGIRGLTVVGLLIMSLAVGGTLAYLSFSTNAVSNTFATEATAPIPVVVEDTGDGDKEIPEGKNEPKFTPDDDGTYTAKKTVKVKNDGAAGYLRMRLTLPEIYDPNTDTYVAYDLSAGESSVDEHGSAAPAPGSNEVRLSNGYTLVFDEGWRANWAYKDGWFYYRYKLPVSTSTTEAKTEPLLKEVKTSSLEHRVDVGVIAETLEDDMIAANTTWGLNSETGCYVVDNSVSGGVKWQNA